MNERKDGGEERVRKTRVGNGSTLTTAQVDPLDELCTVPGNGMIVDCTGFDRGIWLL